LSELLNARAAIADLVHTYAKGVRSGHGGGCARLFTDDATFEVREILPGGGGLSRTPTRRRILERNAVELFNLEF
jgi:hypothetical protein